MEKKVLGRGFAHSPNYPGRAYYHTKRDEPFTSEKKGFLSYKGDPPSGESDPLPRTTFFA